jgi:hypothetical protein
MGPLARWRERAYALATALVLIPAGLDAAEYQVRAGDNLQAVLDTAAPGDVVFLQAGATFRGNFVLGVKSGSGYITVRSSTADHLLPPAGTRITPQFAPLLARVESPNTGPALRTAPGAHHWRLLFLELPPTMLGYYDILQIGDGSGAQSLLSQVPYEIDIDRVYIHGHPLYGQKRGIAMNGRAVSIRNSWISDIKGLGMDTQGIGGWNGPGPVLIENNYIEAAGENILFGGADPPIAGLVTEGIVVRRNYVSRPMSWRDPIVATPQNVGVAPAAGSLPAGTHTYRVVARRAAGGGSVARSAASAQATITVNGGGALVTWSAAPNAEEYLVYGRGQFWVARTTSFTDTGAGGTAGSAPTTPGDVWTVKNLFELKNARRVVVEYNVFENHWREAQSGYAILFTVRNQDGACTWCVVEDVDFHFNVVRNVAAGINILGYDNIHTSAQSRNFRIRHNLFSRISTALGGQGWFLLMGNEPRDILVDHNTIDHDGTTVVYAYGSSTTALPIRGFQFTNNAARQGEYGLNGADYSPTTAIAAYYPAGVVTGNWLQAGNAAAFPPGNWYVGTYPSAFVSQPTGDYRPAPGGVLVGRATDRTNIGADIGLLNAGVGGVIEGTPATLPSVPRAALPPPRSPSTVRLRQ